MTVSQSILHINLVKNVNLNTSERETQHFFFFILFSVERYNPITGVGIPVSLPRPNTSAIFGSSPSSIEYMFIPPSATTRPSKSFQPSQKRRSLSRESLRRSFSPSYQSPPESDGCSSVSDISECGCEERPKSSRKNGNTPSETRKPLSRTTSSRLPNSAQRPCVMKRAKSFTRESTRRASCGTTNDQQVEHLESDLTDETRRTGASATSKIPRKQTTNARSTGLQSSRIPLKRRDVNSNMTANGYEKTGNESRVTKRSAPESQSSGTPLKQTNVKKRTDGSRTTSGTNESVSNSGSSSNIPVRSYGSRPQHHPVSSKIPQPKQRSTRVNMNSKLNDEDKGQEESVLKENDVETAMQAGNQLLKREGTGDEIRVSKFDGTESRLPRSNIPRAHVSKTDQRKLNDIEDNQRRSTTVRSKSNISSNDNSLSGTECGKTEQHGVTKLPGNKRPVEVKTAGRPTVSSRMSQRTDSSHSDTDSVSSKEDAVVEIGNEFCLSRENSRSKIPIMSRKGRISTKTKGTALSGNEISKPAEVVKKSAEKPKQEALSSNYPDSEEFIRKNTVPLQPKWKSKQEEKTGRHGSVKERGDPSLTEQQPQKNELDVMKSSVGKRPEKDTFSCTEEKFEIRQGTGKRDGVMPDNQARELTNENQSSMTTQEQSASMKINSPHEESCLVTKVNDTENSNVENLLMPGDIAGVTNASTCDQSDDSFQTSDCAPMRHVDGSASPERLREFLSEKNRVIMSDEDGAEKSGNETGSNLKGPSGKDNQVSLTLAEKLVSEISEQTDSRIFENGICLERKVPQSLCLEKRLEYTGLKNKDNVRCEMKGTESENHYALSEKAEQTSRSPELDERLAVSGVDKEEEPVKNFDTCFECRVERKEEDEEFLGGHSGDSCSRSNVKRYPTFISPRKSLVLCKYHEKLKSEGDQASDLGKPMVLMSQLTDKNGQLPAVCPPVSPTDTRKDLVQCGRKEVKQKNEKNSLKNTAGNEVNSSVSKRGAEEPLVHQHTAETTERKNETLVRAVNPTTPNSEPMLQSSDQGSTVANTTREKNTVDVTVEKGSHSPLLALSRDKKYVSGENLAPHKNVDAMISVLSLEWDDVGTELSTPNVSEEDEDILEPGSKKRDLEREDDRRPSVKLMDTNEALDKLKVIQSLIMKEAENRKMSAESRRDSVGSAGKYGDSAKESGEECRVPKNNGKYGKYARSLSEEKRLITSQVNPNDDTSSEQVLPKSEVPRREVSSPTIWDRIDDNATSQDQTTELLNETLAKLKASPQLSGSAFARRTISSRSLPGSRQASKERLLIDTERPVCVYTSNWMNTSGKNSVASSLSLRSANRSLPSSRQNLAKDPFTALKRSESASGCMEKDNGKRSESKEKKGYRLSNFDEMLSDDGNQELKPQKSNNTTVSPVPEKPVTDGVQSKKSIKMSKRKKKSKNTAEKMKKVPPSEISMEDLAEGKTNCQCGGKNCVIS